MRWQSTLAVVSVAAAIGATRRSLAIAGRAAELCETLPQANSLRRLIRVIAIRAGRMFDFQIRSCPQQPGHPHQGAIAITNVGSSGEIPAGARVIDLGSATVMPGMIDAHVHVVTGGATPTQRALIAASPTRRSTLRPASPRCSTWIRGGGFNTVDLRDAINSGLVQGPRHAGGGASRSTQPRQPTTIPGFPGPCVSSTSSPRRRTPIPPWLGACQPCARTSFTASTGSRSTRPRTYVGPVHMWKADATPWSTARP